MTSWTESWDERLQELALNVMEGADLGHDLAHVERVVANAKRLLQTESADPAIVIPAAWLHDCVFVPKNSPDRSRASVLASEKATLLLAGLNYPHELLASIAHAIAAHSFSAGIPCETLEAQIVQDADRLEALGAIGISRCLQTGALMKQRLYNPASPFPAHRSCEDQKQSIDHFFQKLFRLPSTMQTAAGRAEAQRRLAIMVQFLEALCDELSASRSDLDACLQSVGLR